MDKPRAPWSSEVAASDDGATPSAQSSDQVHWALINEISELAIGELPSERVFAEALERIRHTFDLDVVAVYAGEPLTLRMQNGGVQSRPGAPVPVGPAQLALQERRVMTSGDIREGGAWLPPPWASRGVRAEVALPIFYRGRRIGVLDLCSREGGALSDPDLDILGIVTRLLAVAIAQESWGRPEASSQELKRVYRRLEEFAELKGQILQNVSHELRTPLTLIKGYLELLMDDQKGELAPGQRRTLETLCDRVDDIVTIVDRTVSLSPLRSLSLDYEKVVVADLLAEMVDLFERRTLGLPVRLEVSDIDPELILYADAQKLKQLCYNLIDNSVKFSPSGGCISVQAFAEEDNVHLVFRDQGIGIPEQQLSQIFETFYQIDGSTTRRFGGLGLGLTVVNRIVEAHGGDVWVESELGRGSSFHILLPKDVPEPQNPGSISV